MRLLDNAGAGAGAAIRLGLASVSKERMVIVWGTVTDVDLEISPDGGTTWVSLQNFTAAGVANVLIGGNYQLRGNVTTGSGVYMDLV